MNELRRTLKAALACPEELVLATVVKASGSVYRRPGARMLFTRDRWVAGTVSGGCIESELREQAWSKTVDGPALMVFDTRSDADILWGYGMGCPGVVEVLVERFDPAGFGNVLQLLESRTPVRLVTDLGHEALGSRAWSTPSGSEGDATLLAKGEGVFVEDLAPGARLVILGAGNDALPLERMAREVGWMTCVADYRAEFAVTSRFPNADQLVTAPLDDLVAGLDLDEQTFVVVMTHGYLADRTLLPQLLDSDCPYVGLVSSRQRSDRLMADLGRERSAKFHAPVGLNLRAEGPEEIALAVLAEMQGVWAECGALV